MYSNPSGTLLLVTVNEKCSGCGACSALSNCFIDGPEGKAIPANGGCFSDEQLMAIKDAIETCPEGAIECANGSIIKANGKISIADIKTFIQKNLIEYRYPRPQYNDYKWTNYRPDVDGEGFYGWSGYNYSSYESAQRAGLRELERVVFDHIDTLISSMLIEYKHEQLTPLITYTESQSNFYYRENMHIKDLIVGIAIEAETLTGKHILDKLELDNINLVPDFGYNGKNFDAFCKIEDHTGMVKGDLESLSRYEPWIDTDDMDTVETGWLGRTKEVTKWSFRAHDAVREVFSDLNSGGKDSMRDYFDYTINSPYQFGGVVKPLEEEVHRVGQKLLKHI